MNYEEFLKITKSSFELVVHVPSKTLAPSHPESARPTIDNIEWLFYRGSGSSAASVSVSGLHFQRLASSGITQPHTVFPLILFL